MTKKIKADDIISYGGDLETPIRSLVEKIDIFGMGEGFESTHSIPRKRLWKQSNAQ